MAEQKEFDPGKAPKKRLPERDPERSKLLLIEATLDALAENGISEATVSKIIARAGVSRGMIHLHFGSKDALIGAAAKLFSERYYDEMERQLTDAANGPTATVLAVVRADLGPQLMNKKSVAIWHALRGEAHRNATIGKYSNTRDRKLRKLISDSFAAVDTNHKGADRSALINDATLGTLALLEGMWTDFMVHPGSFNRDDAFRIVYRFLGGLFPEAFKPIHGDCQPRQVPK